MTKQERIENLKPLKLIPVGNSTGMVIPREILALLRVGRGDLLYVTEGPDGSVRLSPFDPEFAEQMEMAEAIMREDREILRALAK
jgi:putative addiction module antidote